MRYFVFHNKHGKVASPLRATGRIEYVKNPLGVKEK